MIIKIIAILIFSYFAYGDTGDIVSLTIDCAMLSAFLVSLSNELKKIFK